MDKVFLYDPCLWDLDLLEYALQKEMGIQVVGRSSKEEFLFSSLENTKFDVLIADFYAFDETGLKLAQSVYMRFPWSKILALGSNEYPSLVNKLRRIGIRGFVSKTSSLSELTKALQLVIDEQFYFPKSVPTAREKAKEFLTTKELQIIQLIGEGFINKDLAEHLNTSIKTIESHRVNIFRKLKVKNMMMLLKYARDHDLIK